MIRTVERVELSLAALLLLAVIAILGLFRWALPIRSLPVRRLRHRS